MVFHKIAGGDFLKIQIQWKYLIACIAIPLAVGSLSAFFTQNGMEAFSSMNKPVLSPPAWLFPVVWTILYILMGAASYLVLTSGKENDKALMIYGIQLLFNFFWSILFFRWELCLPAFFWLVCLWVLIFKTAELFFSLSKTAGYLMLPYLAWVTFAGYLNLSICILN